MHIRRYNYEILYFRDDPLCTRDSADRWTKARMAHGLSSPEASNALNYSRANEVETLSNPLNEVKLMSIPIPAETPDPMIDDPALPTPKPDVDPPPTMPPVIPTPVGDPPAEEPPAILGDELAHQQGRDLPG
ncbi:Uncharacterised protein [Paucimonas lemoignei]|nr:Uncharacterised protein [Paucimonas lemoignei]